MFYINVCTKKPGIFMINTTRNYLVGSNCMQLTLKQKEINYANEIVVVCNYLFY